MTEEIQNWELKTEREEAIRALPRITAALESIAESLKSANLLKVQRNGIDIACHPILTDAEKTAFVEALKKVQP